MAKTGSEYQELVEMFAKALDEGATVKTGQWIKGPDGKREIDVEVRGAVNNNPHFILIECKDWTKGKTHPLVDIEEIDKLDSKRVDLSADAAIIYSNTGFTKKALRKANRKGISTLSALSEGDDRVKIIIERELYALRTSIDQWRLVLYLYEESKRNLPLDWSPYSLYLNGLPVVNWLHDLSLKLLESNDIKNKIEAVFSFKKETLFHVDQIPIMLRGFHIIASCSQKWLFQTVREDVSLGYYDHISRKVVIPNEQVWTIGPIDRDAWKELDIAPEELTSEIEDNSFRFSLKLYNCIKKIKNYETPAIDNIIDEKKIEIS